MKLVRHWDTFESFLEQVKSDSPLVEEAAKYGSASVGNRPLWFGSNCFGDAVQVAENGWAEGLAKIKQLATSLKPIEGEKADRHVAKFCEAGDEVDIDRYVSGEPECMMDYELTQVPAAGRVVKIVLQISASEGVDAGQYFMRGAAAVMLADLVEQSGLRSEIIVAAGNCCGKNTAEFTIVVKRPDQPLELDRLAFVLAHPSMFRRFIFRIIEQFPRKTFDAHFSSSYGRPINVEVGDAIQVDALQYGFGNNVTKENCAALVDAMIQRHMEPVTA